MVNKGQRWKYRYESYWFIIEIIKVTISGGITAKVVQACHPTRTAGDVADNWSLEKDGPDFQDKGGAAWTLLKGQEVPNG